MKQQIYVPYDDVITYWNAIREEMLRSEPMVLEAANQPVQPYIFHTLSEDRVAWDRIILSALERFIRELPTLSPEVIEGVIQVYINLPKGDGVGHAGQVAVFPFESITSRATKVATWLTDNGYNVPRLWRGNTPAYRVPICLAIIYCGLAIG